MRRKRLLLLSLLIFSLPPAESFCQCNAKKIAKDFRPNLQPYKYDSYAYNNITFTDKPQTIEVLFTAFAGVKYKLVFGTSLFDEDVHVNIYDRSDKTHKRNKLFDNSSGVDNLFWSHEVSAPGNYYIDYEIPAKSNAKSLDGCVVLLIGYLDK